MTSEQVYRWEPALILSLVLAGVGAFFGSVVAILSAVIPLSYVLFGSINSLPDSPSITIERDISKTKPSPGTAVTITLRVRNNDNVVYSDIRVVDAVPDDISVVAGSPRAAFSLRPGAERELEYTVIARRGTSEFSAPYIRIRNLSGTQRETTLSSVSGENTIKCYVQSGDVPLQVANTIRTGSITSRDSGEGLDFHSVREYRSEDRISRVDWRHYAKTNDLTTVEFQEQQSATVLLVVDARAIVNATPFVGHPDGVELVTYAAAQLTGALLDTGHRVGVTVLGVDEDTIISLVETDSAGFPWIQPESQPETATRIQNLLDQVYRHWNDNTTQDMMTANESATQTASTDGGDAIANRIINRTNTSTQVLLLSPLLDEKLLPTVRQLRVSGRDVSCVSPELTGGPGKSATVASFERQVCLDELREIGALIVDWDPEQPLGPVLEQNINSLV